MIEMFVPKGTVWLCWLDLLKIKQINGPQNIRITYPNTLSLKLRN